LSRNHAEDSGTSHTQLGDGIGGWEYGFTVERTGGTEIREATFEPIGRRKCARAHVEG